MEPYTKCDEKTQKYTLTVSGYDTELQAGKNGNANKYGLNDVRGWQHVLDLHGRH